jgi:preprotein translocase subunit SecB
MAEDNKTAANGDGAPQQNQQQFALQKVYIKDLSFEAPMGATAFNQMGKPQINQEFNNKSQKVGDDLYEVVLSFTLTVKVDDKVVYLTEIQQAGIFAIKGLDNNQLTQILNTLCLHSLFPYARETIDTLVTKGGFPPLMLPHINFDVLFAQAVAQAKQKEQAKAQQGPTLN